MTTLTDGRLKTIWQSCGVPKKLKNATLSNYTPNNQNQAQALKKCTEYAASGLENINRGEGLFFFGPVGTGKTHLAVATVQAIISKNPEQFGYRNDSSLYSKDNVQNSAGKYFSFISVVELLNTMREGFRGNAWHQEKAQNLMHQAKINDLVILDDLGAEKYTEWVEEQIFYLVDVRYRMERATIFTSNCSLDFLEKQIGKRTVSRIIEMTIGIKVDGADYRKRKFR